MILPTEVRQSCRASQECLIASVPLPKSGTPSLDNAQTAKAGAAEPRILAALRDAARYSRLTPRRPHERRAAELGARHVFAS